jgi:hypothetical protein
VRSCILRIPTSCNLLRKCSSQNQPILRLAHTTIFFRTWTACISHSTMRVRLGCITALWRHNWIEGVMEVGVAHCHDLLQRIVSACPRHDLCQGIVIGIYNSDFGLYSDTGCQQVDLDLAEWRVRDLHPQYSSHEHLPLKQGRAPCAQPGSHCRMAVPIEAAPGRTHADHASARHRRPANAALRQGQILLCTIYSLCAHVHRTTSARTRRRHTLRHARRQTSTNPYSSGH